MLCSGKTPKEYLIVNKTDLQREVTTEETDLLSNEFTLFSLECSIKHKKKYELIEKAIRIALGMKMEVMLYGVSSTKKRPRGLESSAKSNGSRIQSSNQKNAYSSEYDSIKQTAAFTSKGRDSSDAKQSTYLRSDGQNYASNEKEESDIGSFALISRNNSGIGKKNQERSIFNQDEVNPFGARRLELDQQDLTPKVPPRNEHKTSHMAESFKFVELGMSDFINPNQSKKSPLKFDGAYIDSLLEGKNHSSNNSKDEQYSKEFNRKISELDLNIEMLQNSIAKVESFDKVPKPQGIAKNNNRPMMQVEEDEDEFQSIEEPSRRSVIPSQLPSPPHQMEQTSHFPGTNQSSEISKLSSLGEQKNIEVSSFASSSNCNWAPQSDKVLLRLIINVVYTSNHLEYFDRCEKRRFC